ncbi:MAG: hypothetical protein JO355_09120 [Planctomycetaceae bacterium]|nr:hypothetical protein [Planctomycetaceae bacterium]
MKRPRFRRRWLVPLGVLGLPPLLWTVILIVAPTEWARTKVVEQLGKATGRTIGLGRLRIGPLGDVRLADLEIGSPRSVHDPWLKIGTARINVSVLQLLVGQVGPTEIEVSGLSLRVHRRDDGSLELADLLQPGPAQAEVAPADSASCPDQCEGPSGLTVLVRDATIRVIDEPSRTRLDFTGIEGRATCAGRHAAIQHLGGTLNGGPFELAASLDRSGVEPVFEGQLRARDVALSEGMDSLSYLVPVLSGAIASVEGRLEANLYVRGRGMTRDAMRRSLVGQGAIGLNPIRLDGSKLLAELAALVEMPADARVGSVKTDFAIKAGRVETDNLTINVTKLPIVMTGWTDFDGRLDYRVRSESLTDRIPGKARTVLSDLSIDVNQLSCLRVRGTLDALRVSVDDDGALDAMTGGRDPERRSEERQRLRDLGRKVRDRILR